MILINLRFTKIPLNLPSLAHTLLTPSRGNSSVVEHDLAKVGVAGSNPVSRSKVNFYRSP